MGSVNFFPVSEMGPAPEPKPEAQAEETREISRLYNSIYYYIQNVYIVKFNGSYRLIAELHGRILCDQVYLTLRGAKIAFSKLFNHKLWDKNVKPKWSYFYVPETEWFKKITPATPPVQPQRGET